MVFGNLGGQLGQARGECVLVIVAVAAVISLLYV